MSAGKIFVFVAVCTAMSACSSSQLKSEYARQIRDLGYEPLYPPQEGWEPGLVFQLSTAPDGRKVKQIVCQTLLSEMTPLKKATGLPTTTALDKKDFNFVVSLAKYAIKDVAQAEANLKHSNVRSVKLSYGEGNSEYLAEQSIWQSNGEKVPIVTSCLQALKKYKLAREPHKLLIVSSALSAGKLSLDVEYNQKNSVGGTVNIEKLVDLKPNFSSSSEGNSSLTLNKPVYVGINPLWLDDYVELKELGAATAAITTRPLSAKEQTELLDYE